MKKQVIIFLKNGETLLFQGVSNLSDFLSQKRKEMWMLRHYITKYKEGDRYYAESWLQLELFGKVWCFSCKKIDVTLRF